MSHELNNGIELMLYLAVLLIELWVKKMVFFLWNVNRNLEVKGHDVSNMLSEAQKQSCAYVYLCIHMGKREVREDGGGEDGMVRQTEQNV